MPEFLEAVDEAVDCHNRYVRGSRDEGDTDCESEKKTVRFFETLLTIQSVVF